MEKIPKLEVELPTLEDIGSKLNLGRLWCSNCESYDHECGCSPSILEIREKQTAQAIHTMIKDKLKGADNG